MLGALLLFAFPANAQPPGGRLDVGGGVGWLGGTAFARVPAREITLANGRLTLFNSDSQLDPASRFEARVGVRLSSFLHVESTFSYAKPNLLTRITADLEGIPDTTVGDRITQYTIEGGATAQLARWRLGRLAPFAAGGVGYLRQLHEGRQLIETGRTYYAGGGFRYPLAARAGMVRSAGLRADIRAEFLEDGVTLEEKIRTVPAVSASFFVTF